jgi:hypothetical protein
MMAILLAETLITFGAALQRWCQGQEAGVPFTDAINLQPAVVPVVGIGVIKSLSHSCCFGIGVDIPEGIQRIRIKTTRRNCDGLQLKQAGNIA